MTEKAREARREYMRRWNAANKDRVRAYNERYWERRAAAIKADDNVQSDHDGGLHNSGKFGG